MTVAQRQVHSADGGYEQAVAAAVQAKTIWGILPARARAEALVRISGEIAHRRQAIRDALIADVGKPFSEADAEIDAALNMLAFFAGWPLWGRTQQVATLAGFPEGSVMLKPRGVAGLITPWNYPISNPVQKIAAALVCGNPVLWRPSIVCGHSSLLLAEAIDAAGLPDGVFSVLLEDGSYLSRRLVADSRVDAISFTGSTAVGKDIYATASARLATVQCEMGGKNAAVVLADADLELAAKRIALGAFSFAGQKCTALSRVFIVASVADRFLALLQNEINALPFGDPVDPRTVVGPVISAAKKAELVQACAEAEARGLRRVPLSPLRIGNTDGDAFFPPTLFSHVPPSDPLMQEELFGPVLALAEVGDLDEALRCVNACGYGLAASIFTVSRVDAQSFAARAEVGVVKINQATPGLSVGLPASGWKNSGAGIGELAEESIRFFTKPTSVFA